MSESNSTNGHPARVPAAPYQRVGILMHLR
jgi:hypothetical protein